MWCLFTACPRYFVPLERIKMGDTSTVAKQLKADEDEFSFFEDLFWLLTANFAAPHYWAAAVNKLFSKTNGNFSLESNFSRGYKLIFLPVDRPPMVNAVNPSEAGLPPWTAVNKRLFHRSFLPFLRSLMCVENKFFFFYLLLLVSSAILPPTYCIFFIRFKFVSLLRLHVSRVQCDEHAANTLPGSERKSA